MLAPGTFSILELRPKLVLDFDVQASYRGTSLNQNLPQISALLANFREEGID